MIEAIELILQGSTAFGLLGAIYLLVRRDDKLEMRLERHEIYIESLNERFKELLEGLYIK